MKNLMPKVAFLCGAIFTAFILFAVVHNSTNDRHHVEFFEGSQHVAYENTPAIAQINVSPSIAWDHVGQGWKILGWLMVAALWVSIWLVSTYRHIGKRKLNDGKGNGNGKAAVMIITPILLALIFFFGGYSSKYVSNYEEIERSRFDQWVKSGVIEQKGEKTYVDKSDSIKLLFNRKFIN